MMNDELRSSRYDSIDLMSLLLTAVVILSLVACLNKEESASESKIVQNPAQGAWQDREPPPIRFELEQTYGSENDADEDGFMFSASYYIAGPVADSDGNIYLIDRERSRLLSFDSEGKLRWQTGQEGRGPGDLLNPYGIVIRQNALYFDNINGTRIDEYDLKGNFIRSIPITFNDLSFIWLKGVLNNGHLVGSSTIRGKIGNRISIFELTDSLKKIHQFDVQILKDLDIGERLSRSLSVSILDSLIAFGNLQDYEISFYDDNGRKIKAFTRDFEKLVRPGFLVNSATRAVRTFGSLQPPIKLSSGYLITTLQWPINIDDPDDYVKKSTTGNPPPIQYTNAMDLFSPEGTLLYSAEKQEFPKIGNITNVDSEGYLYTVSNEPYPQIRRYRVTIQEE